jgi:hypothetical protein
VPTHSGSEQRPNKELRFVVAFGAILRISLFFAIAITVIEVPQPGNLAIQFSGHSKVGKMEAHNDLYYTARESAAPGVPRRLDCKHAVSELVPRRISNLACRVSITATSPAKISGTTPSHVEPRNHSVCIRSRQPTLRIPEGHHQEVMTNPMALLGSFPLLSFVRQFDYRAPACRIPSV